MERFDVVIVGAGVFGAWTASHFARRDKRVLLVDSYGPGNARASSAGESRIIRMGYGADEIYTRLVAEFAGAMEGIFWIQAARTVSRDGRVVAGGRRRCADSRDGGDADALRR